MAQLSDVVKRRKADLKALQSQMREVDSAQERLERRIKQMTARKKKVPEADDALELIELAYKFGGALNVFDTMLKNIGVTWGAV